MACEPLLAYHAPSEGVDIGPIVESCHEELLKANDKRGQPMKKDGVDFINLVPKDGLPRVKTLGINDVSTVGDSYWCFCRT